MKRLALLLAALVALACASKPPPDATQRHIAAIVAVGANEAFPILLDRYVAEGEAAVLMASSEEEARSNVAVVRAKWRPIWVAWDVFVTAHDAWRASLAASDGDILRAAIAAREAYCGVVKLSPVELPEMIGVRCESVRSSSSGKALDRAGETSPGHGQGGEQPPRGGPQDSAPVQ